MEEFEISGNGDFIKITFDKVYGFPDQTCHWGGYELNCFVKVEIDDFKVNSTFYSSTGEIYHFYNTLSNANSLLAGNVHFSNYENNLEFDLTYNLNGQIDVKGSFCKHNAHNSKLTFEYVSDQSYIQSTLKQLQAIVAKYGDDKGVK